MSPQDDAQDAAWASFLIPLDPAALHEFCTDVERLFRINPLLEFESWQSIGEGRYHFKGRNLSQSPPFTVDVELVAAPQADGILITYASGIKSSTRIKIESDTVGAQVTIIDSYEGLSEEERQSHLHEVDKSLVAWAKYLQEYLLAWKRWSRIPPWRWYMRRVWQPMKPSARRIAYMLIWITVVELVVITAIAVFFVFR